MLDKFTVPVGAQPFAPGSIVPSTALNENSNTVGKSEVDPSRIIPGLNMEQAPADIASPGLKIDKIVDLTGERPATADVPREPIKSCPACGALLEDPSEVLPTDEDKDAWLRHVLGETRFVRTYTLFGGKVEITFRTRTSAENDIIFNQLSDEVRAGEINEFGGIMSPAYYARLNRLMLMYSLKGVEFRDKTEPIGHTYPEVTDAAYPKADDKDERPLVVRAHDKLFGGPGLSAGLLAGMQTVHRRFESLVVTMTRHADDPGFWDPAG